jgi:hypothetical protein
MLGILFFVVGIVCGFGYLIYGTVYCIFDFIELLKADTITFGQVGWLVFMWMTREFFAAIIMITSFMLGAISMGFSNSRF